MENDKKISLILIWLVILSLFYMFGWTYTLKTNTPAGTDNPTEADDRMREIKAAFVERLDIDHYWTASATSTYDATDTGKHRYVTFQGPNDLTSMAADESAIFSKNVSSVTEFHWIDESDNVLQITSGGTLNIVSADLLGTLANDTYFTAVDAAGTGTVDLIKANASDVAVIPDGSELATSGAPTADADIANMKYVVDQVAAIQDPAYSGGESHAFDGGLIVKGGTHGVNGSQGITFGTAFPNAVIMAGATINSATVNSATVGSVTKTGLTIYENAAGSVNVYWWAMGY